MILKYLKKNKLNIVSLLYSFIRFLLGKLLISLGLTIIILCCFIYFYRHALSMDNQDGTTDIKWLPNQLLSNMKEGFAFFRCDKNGFCNTMIPNDYVDFLVMGTSHTEAHSK